MKSTLIPFSVASALLSHGVLAANLTRPIITRGHARTQQATELHNAGMSLNLAVADECSFSEIECDGGCIPLLGECCDTGDGSWCDLESYCDQGGCCPLFETCSGGSDDDTDDLGCESGYEPCGALYCMPEGSECCGDGYYCDEGETCTPDGFCDLGGGGGDDDDDDDDDTGGDDTNECEEGEEDCDGFCMPEGSECCGDGYYCDDGEECTSTGCVPINAVDCDDGTYCFEGEECTDTACIPEGAEDCGEGFFCEDGQVCGEEQGDCVDPEDAPTTTRDSDDATSTSDDTISESGAEETGSSSGDDADAGSSLQVTMGSIFAGLLGTLPFVVL